MFAGAFSVAMGIILAIVLLDVVVILTGLIFGAIGELVSIIENCKYSIIRGIGYLCLTIAIMMCTIWCRNFEDFLCGIIYMITGSLMLYFKKKKQPKEKEIYHHDEFEDYF